MAQFIGRTGELEVLQREYARKRSSLIVIYGRRRVGKSTLILKSLEGSPFVYYQANKLTDGDNLRLLKEALVVQLRLDEAQQTILQSLDWPGFWVYLENLAKEHPGLCLVLDEFPYLCEAQPALPSLIQAAWDRIRARNLDFKLVLCGSSIAFMEELLAERNPLRGRQTVELDLQPLSFREVAQWFPKWTAEDRLKAFGVFGGMPYYLSLLEPTASLGTNLLEAVLYRGAPLYDEPNLLLQSELTSVARYASVLSAIAEGCHEWGEIIGRVKDFKDGAQLTPYMNKLQALRLVEGVSSFNAGPKERGRRYELSDPFLAFWYRFVLPNRSALEAGHAKAVLKQQIEPKLDEYMGGMFERICRDYVRLFVQEILGQPAHTVGRIWAGDYDLDVVAKLLDGTYVFGECKWWKDPVGENVLSRLKETLQRTGLAQSSTHLMLFSKTGFTPSLKQQAKADPKLHLLTPTNLLGRSGHKK